MHVPIAKTDFEGETIPNDDIFGHSYVSIIVIIGVVMAVVAVVPAIILIIFRCCRRDCCRRCREEGDRNERSLIADKFAAELARRDRRRTSENDRLISNSSLEDLDARLTNAINEQGLKTVSRERKYTDNSYNLRSLSLYYYAAFWVGLAAMLVNYFIGLPKLFGYPDEFSTGTTFHCQIGTIVVVVWSVLYLYVESYYAVEWKRIKRIESIEKVMERIGRIRNEPPDVRIKIEAYHYEQRSRSVYRNGRWETEYHSAKVVTHNSVYIFNHHRYWQVLPQQPAIHSDSGHGLTKLDVHPTILFGDPQTKVAFDNELNRYRYLDQHVDFSLPGLNNMKLLTFADADSRPCWINPFCYWVAVLMMMTWPYRWLFDCSTSHTDFAIVKIIYCNQPSFGSTGVNNTSTLSTATGDSTSVGSQSPPTTTRDVIVMKLNSLRNSSDIDGNWVTPKLAEPHELLQASQLPVYSVNQLSF